MNILVVDDSLVQRRLLSKTLERWGYTVFEASDGVEAIEIIQRESIPMVITDWMMPRMDGAELCRAIRSEDGMIYHYVILLTSRNDKESMVRGLDCGADDYVAKPFSPGELAARIHVGERILGLQEELRARIDELGTLNKRISDAHRKMQDDLTLAAEVQKAFLPHRVPPCRSAHFEWRWRPCGSLGGDYLNVFPLAKDLLGLLVLDVSGHGIPAALMAVTLSRILQPQNEDSALMTIDPFTGHRTPTSPVEVAKMLNRKFPLDPETGQYFTMFYGLFDADKNTLQYTTAGSPGPIHQKADGSVKLLDGYDFPIGVQIEPEYESHLVQLGPLDRLLIVTDGIFEAADAEGKQFGEQGMIEVLGECHRTSLDNTLEQLIAKVVDYSLDNEPADDISILAFEALKFPKDNGDQTTLYEQETEGLLL